MRLKERFDTRGGRTKSAPGAWSAFTPAAGAPLPRSFISCPFASAATDAAACCSAPSWGHPAGGGVAAVNTRGAIAGNGGHAGGRTAHARSASASTQPLSFRTDWSPPSLGIARFSTRAPAGTPPTGRSSRTAPR